MKPYNLLGFMIIGLLFCFVLSASAEELKILSVWDGSTGKEGYKIFIVEKEESKFLVKQYANGEVTEQSVFEILQNGGTVYQPEDDSGEYYLVEKSGEAMQILDSYGVKETLKADVLYSKK